MPYKQFLQSWLLPPEVYNQLKGLYFHWKKEKIPDLRMSKWWNGEPVASPPQNVRFFIERSDEAQSITFKHETRDCLLLKQGESVRVGCQDSIDDEWSWKLSFATVDTASQGTVSIESVSKTVASLTDLLSEKWNTVRFKGGSEHSVLMIRNDSNADIYVSHPIREISFTPRQTSLASRGVEPGQESSQNIIYIILDGVWRDLIGIYQKWPEASLTPFIDSFFADSTIYENCFSIAEWTMPSIYSMLTSQYPISHGRTDFKQSIPEFGGSGRRSFVEKFSPQGFATMACSTAKVFTPAFSGNIGFDRFFYDLYSEFGRTDQVLTDRAIEQIRSNEEGRNFLFLHYIDTHDAWPNPTFAEESKLQSIRTSNPFKEYTGLMAGTGDSKGEPIFGKKEIEVLNRRTSIRLQEVDLNLQKLFNYLEMSGLAATTSVILTADHGNLYMGRGRPLLSNTRVNVPLLIKDCRFGKQLDRSMVNLGLDIGPTIAQMAGIDWPSDLGRVLGPMGSDQARDAVISESAFGERYKVSVRTREHVFHLHLGYDKVSRTIDLSDEIEVFLFAVGAEEVDLNVAAQQPEVVKKMREHVQEHLKEHADQISWK
jgi:arylsulfatase A-like enzyme